MPSNSFDINLLNKFLEQYADQSNLVGKFSRLMLSGGFGSYRYVNENIDPEKSYLAKEEFLDLSCSSFEKRDHFDFSTLERMIPDELLVQNLNKNQFNNKKLQNLRIENTLDYYFIRIAKESSVSSLRSTTIHTASFIETLKASDLINNHTSEDRKKIATLSSNEPVLIEKINFKTLEFLRSELQKIDSFFGEYEETLLKYNHLDEPVDVKKQKYLESILKLTNKAFWTYAYRAFRTQIPYDQQNMPFIESKIEKLSRLNDEPKVIFSAFSEYLKEIFEKMLANELLINELLPTIKLLKDEREIEVKKVDYKYKVTPEDDFSVDINQFCYSLNNSNKNLNVVKLKNAELILFKETPSKDDIVKLVNHAKESETQVFVEILHPNLEIPRGALYAVNPDKNTLTIALQIAGLSNEYDLESLKTSGMLGLIDEDKKVELKYAELTLSDYIKQFIKNDSDSDLSRLEKELFTYRHYLEFPDFLEPIIKIAFKEGQDFKTILGRHSKFIIDNSQEVTEKFRKADKASLNLEACLLIRNKDKRDYLFADNEIPIVNEIDTLVSAFEELTLLCKSESVIQKKLEGFKDSFIDNYGISFEEFKENTETSTAIIDPICDDLIELLEKIQNSLLQRKKLKGKNKKLSVEIGKIKQRFLPLNVLEYLRLKESVDYLFELDKKFEAEPFNPTFTPKNVIYSLSKDEMEKLIDLVDIDDLEEDEKIFHQLAFLQSFAEMKFLKVSENFSALASIVKTIKERNSKFSFRGFINAEEFEEATTVFSSGNYGFNSEQGIVFVKYNPNSN